MLYLDAGNNKINIWSCFLVIFGTFCVKLSVLNVTWTHAFLYGYIILFNVFKQYQILLKLKQINYTRILPTLFKKNKKTVSTTTEKQYLTRHHAMKPHHYPCCKRSVASCSAMFSAKRRSRSSCTAFCWSLCTSYCCSSAAIRKSVTSCKQRV